MRRVKTALLLKMPAVEMRASAAFNVRKHYECIITSYIKFSDMLAELCSNDDRMYPKQTYVFYAHVKIHNSIL